MVSEYRQRGTRNMEAMRSCNWGVALLFFLAACSGDKFEGREARIEAALEDNRDVGVLGSEAVWLVKATSLAPRDRTAVFFGYGDNYAACVEFAEAHAQIYEDRYRCESLG